MKKGLLVVVFAAVALALLASAVGPAAAKGPARGHLNWNAVWYPPTNTYQSDGSTVFEMQVKMDDPLGPGKVRYDAVITLNGGYSDALGTHVTGCYDFYILDGQLAWHCSFWDHYVDPNAPLPYRYALPDVAYGAAASPYHGWEAHLTSGQSAGEAQPWTMKGYFVPPAGP
jgi:hypothetical protein